MKLPHDIPSYRNVLKQVLMQFGDVPQHELEEFTDAFYPEVFKKNTTIISPNNTELKGYFIVKGLVRIYYVINQKEITSDFRESNSFFLNGYTTFSGKPNFDYFDAIEETTCLVIDWNRLEMLLKKYHALEHLGRKIIEWHFMESMRVSYNTLFLNADERYFNFMKERSELQNRVPLKYIATYLGLTQETLSRLRAKHQSEKL